MKPHEALELGMRLGYFHKRSQIGQVTRKSIKDILDLQTLNKAIDQNLLPYDATIIDLPSVINQIKKQ